MSDVEERPIDLEAASTHPILHAFHAYWRTLPNGGGLPGRQHIDPADIRDLLPWLIMLDVERPLPRPAFRFRLAGTGIVGLYDLEITGSTVQKAFPEWAAELNEDFAKAMVARRPTYLRRPLPIPGKHYRSQESLICPLAADGQVIDMLIGVVTPLRHKQNGLTRQSAA